MWSIKSGPEQTPPSARPSRDGRVRSTGRYTAFPPHDHYDSVERRRALQARAALNARKGFTHWLRAGDLDGMVARGAAHKRQRASEGVKGGSF